MDDTCIWTSLASYAAEVYPFILQGDLIRYVAGAGGTFLVVNTLLAGWLARRQIRDERPDWRQMSREIIASLRTVLIFSLVGLVIALSERLGWLAIYEDPLELGLPYFLFNLAVLIVLHDAWFYWTHKIMHRPGLYRWFHRLHHRSHNPSPWTSYAFDASEAAVNAIYLPLALLLMPTSLLAAFLFVAHMMLRNAIGPLRLRGISGAPRRTSADRMADDRDAPRPAPCEAALEPRALLHMVGPPDVNRRSDLPCRLRSRRRQSSCRRHGRLPEAARPRLEGMRKHT